MAKILQIQNDNVFIGSENGNITEAKKSDCDFFPHVGDEVQVFTSGDRCIVTKAETSPKKFEYSPTNYQATNPQVNGYQATNYQANGYQAAGQGFSNNQSQINAYNTQDKSAWDYFTECMSTKYCCFRGRARRKEFWSFAMFYSLISLAIQIPLAFTGNPVLLHIIPMIVGFAMMLPYLGVVVRRLHDINCSGWLLGTQFLIFLILLILAVIAAAGAIINYASM